ncbi:GM17011 [Drosophila sechellia]|uniref:GM17011 n=2 Tax=Drosophila sechellia TaxID=7238 RepID=B4HYN3_DROSE|nr:GM17011 [Drosophila sechellia]
MRRLLNCGHNETEELKYKLLEVQKELDEANYFIAEIKFELDSVDIPALQNQWLRDELMMLKAEEVGVIRRDLEEDPATQKERRSYRQQVAAGMVSPQLECPLQEQRYGRKLD